MVHREQHSFYHYFFKGVYLGGHVSSLRFKYEPKVTAFLEVQEEAKERFTELANPYITTSRLLIMSCLICRSYGSCGPQTTCGIPQQYQKEEHVSVRALILKTLGVVV